MVRGLPGDDTDDQARWIEATVVGTRAVRLCGLYLPNGNPAPGPKYDYKLAWMARMEARVKALLQTEEPVVFLGDFKRHPAARGRREARRLGRGRPLPPRLPRRLSAASRTLA